MVTGVVSDKEIKELIASSDRTTLKEYLDYYMLGVLGYDFSDLQKRMKEARDRLSDTNNEQAQHQIR